MFTFRTYMQNKIKDNKEKGKLLMVQYQGLRKFRGTYIKPSWNSTIICERGPTCSMLILWPTFVSSNRGVQKT